MPQKQLQRKAFSLLELSVVSIIIGILLSGIIFGKRMIAQSALQSAQALTKSSIIYSIPDLKLWLETSLEDSIVGTDSNNISDGNKITSWNDISGNKINVAQSTTDNQPTYLLRGINNLPSINFDGIDDYLFTSSPLVPLSPGDDDFTFIVVWKRIATNSNPGVLFDQNNNGVEIDGGSAGIRTQGNDKNTAKYGFEGENNNFFNVDYTYGSAVISVITLDTRGIIKTYTNSNSITTSGNINISTQNIKGNIFVVGARGTATKDHYFPGLISEIMVFDRDLNPTEIAKIVNYLSRKYNITLS